MSALSFLTAYVLLAVEPGIAALVGWFVAMWSRQIGHFFFEPKDYDEVNQPPTSTRKRSRSATTCAARSCCSRSGRCRRSCCCFDPTLCGLFDAHTDCGGFVDNVALMWLVLGAAGLLFRTVQLFFIRGVQTGLVWCTKILTDPFHDVQLYHKSPLYLLRGELIDPMHHVHVDGAAAEVAAGGDEPTRAG